MPSKVCQWCNAGFQCLAYEAKKANPRRFCSGTCAAKWRNAQPEIVAKRQTPTRRAASLKALQRANASPKLQKHLNSNNNPFKTAEVREKSLAACRARGFDHLNGGNGTGFSLAQQTLISRLPGWIAEYVVSTDNKRGSGFPNHYKIDIACPEKRIAVEIDGRSHSTKKVQAADEKKTQWLQDRGWIVLRFSNSAVLSNVEQVASEINSTATNRFES